MKTVTVNMIVNDEEITLDVLPNARLVDVLRDEVRCTGVKEGCGVGECGACTVIVDGESVNSCLILAASMEGRHITTIEGLMKDEKLHPIQGAILDFQALQCGFCTPGLILSIKALLDENEKPERVEIQEAISGNLCRCTGYEQVIKAVESLIKE